MYAPRHAAIPSPESEVIDDLRVNGKHRQEVVA